MTKPLIIIIIGAIFLLIYWTSIHNKLISLKNQFRQNFSGIDIQLKKRWDLIPQLVATVKGYAAHEAKLLESVTKARALAKSLPEQSPERLAQEEIITKSTPQIFALSEQYPDLKSNQQFLLLQRNLTEIESQISASRRSYNASVLKYNNLVMSFPSSIIASRNNHTPVDFFSIQNSERNNVKIS